MDINYQILDHINASIYWKDLNGVYVGCNKYMVMMTDLPDRNYIIGKTDYSLPWHNQANKITEIDRLVIATGKTYEITEHPVIHNNIRKVYFSSKAPLRDEQGNIIGIIGISIDITEKHHLEEILKSTQEALDQSSTIKERFLQNISHETRNPLQAFVCTAETLVDNWDKFSNTQRFEAVMLIAESSRRLATLVNNTFDLSDLIAGNTPLQFKNINITELIQQAINALNDSWGTCSKARIILSNLQDHYVVLDPEKITQVLNNLLINALKWTGAGKTISNVSSWVLSTHAKSYETLLNNDTKEIAVQYFLQELPVFLRAPEILHVPSCLFVYHTIPCFLKEIYDHYQLSSQSQGFGIYSASR